MSSIKNPINGHFILCGKPVFEEEDIVNWIGSYVKLTEIKTIHNSKNSTDENEKCFFHTYKDEWYAVSGLNCRKLTKLLNEYLDKGKQ